MPSQSNNAAIMDVAGREAYRRSLAMHDAGAPRHSKTPRPMTPKRRRVLTSLYDEMIQKKLSAH